MFSFLTLLALFGCSGDPDRTGDGEGGLGPPGVNSTSAPQTEEEAYKQQLKEEAEAQKKYRSGK